MKQLPLVILKGCPFVGVSLCSMCIPSGFHAGTRFVVNKIHVFPQGVLTVITLVGGGAVEGGSREESGVSQSFPFAQWLSLPYQGPDVILSCWSRNPES